MNQVELSKDQLRKDAETFTYPQLRDKYKLSVAELKKAMNHAGIVKPKVKTPKFVFVDDITPTELPSAPVSEVTEMPTPTAPEFD